jgi:O-antigen/teichoic acid export membrane protein
MKREGYDWPIRQDGIEHFRRVERRLPEDQKNQPAGRVSTSHILLARLIAAILNVAPPMVGSYALGRETYGVVASVLAIAVIVFGPVSQYLSQNLLRVLCTAQRAERPMGAAIIFCTGCAALIELGHLAGVITISEALQLSTLIVALLLLRICEVQLISDERIVSSIAVYYAAPPVFCSAFYVVAASLGGGHAAAAAAQSLGYCVAALFAMLTAKGVGKLLAQGLRSPAVSAAREFAASLPLMISGGATAAAEFLPVVLLRGMNAFAVIPVFEIARKFASMPTTLVNPLLNQVNPSMIRAYAANDQPAIHTLLRGMFRFLVYTGIVFACGVAATLIASLYEPRIQEVSALLIPLSIGSVAALWCIPYQSLLIAARGDHWFAISSGVAVVLLLVLTHLFSALGPGLAVACAVGLSVAASGLIVRYRAIKET